jgi:hypothetical protein
MILNALSTFDRLTLVKAALDKAAEGLKKATAAEHYRQAEAAHASRDDPGTVVHMNAASRALF